VKRVFYVITELDVGGAEKTLYELVTRLDRRRFDPAVGCLSGRGPIGERLRKAGVRVIHLDFRGWWDLVGLRRLRRAIRRERPHVLHMFLFHAGFAGRLAALGLKVPLKVYSVRVEEPRRRHLLLDRLTRGLVDRVACVSESAAAYVRRRVRFPPEKVVVIPNGVDVQAWRVQLLSAPRAWGIPDGAPVVGVVGRLDAQKDPLTMVEAARIVKESVPEVVFAFAGDGALAARCRRKAARLGVEENIRWLGWLDDPRPLFARMYLLALSSRWEGMPNVVLEAMAAARPVVASAVGGVPELVADGVTGYVVPPGDPRALAERITTLLEDAERRRAMGQAAQDRVLRHFTLERMVRRHEALYDCDR